MLDVGYVLKRIESRPHWLNAGVTEVCSVSNCVSAPPPDWVHRWLHNDLGLFNSIADAISIAPAEERGGYRLFGYRLYPEFFRNGSPERVGRMPDRIEPIPSAFRSLGFDAVSKSMESILGFECSPLSCNSMAEEIETNVHCLFPSLETALIGAKRFSLEQPEPGDYYILEVLEGEGGPS